VIAVSLVLPTYLPSLLSRALLLLLLLFSNAITIFSSAASFAVFRYLADSRHLGSPAPTSRVSSLAPLSFEPFGSGFGS
jgi:hypothetical protein